MTERPEPRRCRWCGRRLPPAAPTGRPRAYCAGSCRQRAYEARLRAADAGLAEYELVVTRAELDDLHDRLYVLEAAIEDVERDVAASNGDVAAYREALEWVLDAARPLVTHRLGDSRPSP